MPELVPPPDAIDDSPQSAWTPLRHATFRMLWIAWTVANLCMWMNDVAAAWLMTTLTASPMMVALVQTAATLPVFLFGVPSGALADILDRRRFFLATQLWLAGVAIALGVAALTDALSAPLLLLLTFANGIGLALRWPVYAAIVPEVVPRRELPTALALNGIGMNLSRIVGPAVAGAVIATAGSAFVFMLNAILALATGIMLLRWKRARTTSTLPSERFFAAMRVGLQHVRQSVYMHAILLRVAVFFLQSTALLALLPLVALRLPGGGAGTFTLLLAAMGSGAIVSAMVLPRLRERVSRDQIVAGGSLLHASATLAVALAPNLYVAVAAMVAAGMAWIAVANSLTVAAQMALPDWVRARGMSIVQIAIMGGSAVGAALWGQVAALTSVRLSLVLAASVAIVGVATLRRFTVGGRAEEDLTPARIWKAPELAIPVELDQGPVLVTVEYQIDPARAAEFVALMRESRRVWLSNGLLAWELFRDTSDPGRYVEHFVDESWAEYVRRNERVSASYLALREQKLAFHLGERPPAVKRLVAEPVART